MTILVDCDDVMWELLPAWVDYLNNHHGLNKTIEAMQQWDMNKNFPELTTEQIFNPLHTAELWEAVKPKQDAIHYMNKLVEDKHEVYCVTASSPESLIHKYPLFKKYFSFLPKEHFITCYNKRMIKGEVLLDDYYKNLSGRRYPVLYSAVHNQTLPANRIQDVHRVSSWKEFYTYINNLNNS